VKTTKMSEFIKILKILLVNI